MTQERFNEIISKCKKEVPGFMHKAIWGFSESIEPNSIEVNVTHTRKIAIGGKDIETHFSGKSLTQEEEYLFAVLFKLSYVHLQTTLLFQETQMMACV